MYKSPAGPGLPRISPRFARSSRGQANLDQISLSANATAGEGIEPSFTASKAGVLPLDDPAIALAEKAGVLPASSAGRRRGDYLSISPPNVFRAESRRSFESLSLSSDLLSQSGLYFPLNCSAVKHSRFALVLN